MGRKRGGMSKRALLVALAAVSAPVFAADERAFFETPIPLSKSTTSGSGARQTMQAGPKRKIASYSDQEIIKNENEKIFMQNGMTGQIRSVRIGTPAEVRAAATMPVSCAFGPKDFWYAYGYAGGCGVNAGNQAGKSDGDVELNRKMACALNTDFTKCKIEGLYFLDGFNTDINCGKGWVFDRNVAVGKTGGASALSSNPCLSPAQLEKIRTMMLSLFVPPKMRLLKVIVGGYPGINCTGGWAADIYFGTCSTGPIDHDEVPNAK